MYQRIEEVVEPVHEPKRVLEPFTDDIVESAPARMKYKPNRKVVEESVSDFKRVRLLYQTALMVSEMEAVRAEDSEEVGELQPYAVESTAKLEPVPIVWRDGGDKVYVTGTFDAWQKQFKLHRR